MNDFEGSFSSRVIEALGFRFALTTTLEQNWSSIIVEGDALQVVQSLNQIRSFADIDTIILDCIRLAFKLSSCNFSHIKKECNRVAHYVAKQSLSSTGPVNGRVVFPQWLTSLTLDDVKALGPAP